MMFEKQAATDFGLKENVLHREIGQLLRALEQIQEDQIRRTLEPKEKPQRCMTPIIHRRWRCCGIRTSLARIVADSAACGVVGEETNKLMGYITAVSRKLEQPLAIVGRSSSATGARVVDAAYE